MGRVKIHISEVKPTKIGNGLVMVSRVKAPKESKKPSRFLSQSVLWIVLPFTVMRKKGRDRKK